MCILTLALSHSPALAPNVPATAEGAATSKEGSEKKEAPAAGKKEAPAAGKKEAPAAGKKEAPAAGKKK